MRCLRLPRKPGYKVQYLFTALTKHNIFWWNPIEKRIRSREPMVSRKSERQSICSGCKNRG